MGGVKLIAWLLTHVLALGAATYLLDGISLTTAASGRGRLVEQGGQGDQLLTLIAVGLIFGVVTAVVKPVVKFFSFPFIVLTLGLLLLVINAVMLLLTSAIAEALDLGFTVTGFGTALVGGVIISVVSMVLELVLPGDDR